jgi:prolyl oligopeptidase
MRYVPVALIVLCLHAVASAEDKPAAKPADTKKESSPTTTFLSLPSTEWEWALRDQPAYASMAGFRAHNADWPDLSVEAFEKRQKHRHEVLEKLRTIDPEKLSSDNRLNYTLFRKGYEEELEGHPHLWHLLPVDHFPWSIQDQSYLIRALQFETVKDYEDWLARMSKFPAYMDQTIALMRQGMKAGRVHPKAVVRRVPTQVKSQLVEKPEASQFYKPFLSFPKSIGEEDRQRIAREARTAITEKVIPAYRRLLTFIENEYLRVSSDEVGVSHWPGGRELYAYLVRLHTNTMLTPDEIHEIGLKEVERIRGEMEAIKTQVGFKGSFEEF